MYYFLRHQHFFFLTFNLIFYLFLMRVMVAIFVTAYSEVSREIERIERKNKELNRIHQETLKHLPSTFSTSTCGWFLNAYIFSGTIACLPEPPSVKHVLQALKAEPELLKKRLFGLQRTGGNCSRSACLQSNKMLWKSLWKESSHGRRERYSGRSSLRAPSLHPAN